MNKQLLDLLLTDEVQDQIVDLYCKLDKERYIEGSHMGNGWGWQIILDLNGNVNYMYSSFTTIRSDIYNGDAVVVATLSDNAEVPTECMGDIEELEHDKLEKFKEYLINEFKSKNENASEEEMEEYIEDHLNWSNYYDYDEEDFHRVEAEAWECICDCYSYDRIKDKIHNKIDELSYTFNE